MHSWWWRAAQSCPLCLQDAIQEKKKVLAEKAATLHRTLGRSKGELLDPLDDSSLSRSAKVRTIAVSNVQKQLLIIYRAHTWV